MDKALKVSGARAPRGLGLAASILVAAFLVAGCATTIAEGTDELASIRMVDDSVITAEYVAVPFREAGRTICLEGMLYRNKERSSWPGIVVTHGRRGPVHARNRDEVQGYATLNLGLAARGYAVLFLVRRGYGRSAGGDAEFRDWPAEVALEAARDLAAGVEYLRSVPGVDPSRITVMGHSQGGWAALGAASSRMEGVALAVNIGGGTNYRKMGFGTVTERVQRDWIRGAAELGKRNEIPTLWIYSENDRNHPPERVQEAFAAFVGADGKGELVLLEPYGDNGHMIVRDPALFLDLLDR